MTGEIVALTRLKNALSTYKKIVEVDYKINALLSVDLKAAYETLDQVMDINDESIIRNLLYQVIISLNRAKHLPADCIQKLQICAGLMLCYRYLNENRSFERAKADLQNLQYDNNYDIRYFLREHGSTILSVGAVAGLICLPIPIALKGPATGAAISLCSRPIDIKKSDREQWFDNAKQAILNMQL